MRPLNFDCHIHGQFLFLSSFIFVMFAITILWQPDFNPKKSLKNFEESWPLRCDNSNLITACVGWIEVISWCPQGLQPGPPWSWSMWWPNSNLRKKWKKPKQNETKLISKSWQMFFLRHGIDDKIFGFNFWHQNSVKIRHQKTNKIGSQKFGKYFFLKHGIDHWWQNILF